MYIYTVTKIVQAIISISDKYLIGRYPDDSTNRN